MKREDIKKHREVFNAWLDGAEIEFYDESEKLWKNVTNPEFYKNLEYRIKKGKANTSFDTMEDGFHWICHKELSLEEAYVIEFFDNFILKSGINANFDIDEIKAQGHKYIGPVEPPKGLSNERS